MWPFPKASLLISLGLGFPICKMGVVSGRPAGVQSVVCGGHCPVPLLPSVSLAVRQGTALGLTQVPAAPSVPSAACAASQIYKGPELFLERVIAGQPSLKWEQVLGFCSEDEPGRAGTCPWEHAPGLTSRGVAMMWLWHGSGRGWACRCGAEFPVL